MIESNMTESNNGIMENVEKLSGKVISEFEKKPIASTIKGIAILWILKEVIKWFKK